MAVSNDGTSRCGLCRFYSHEGRRGGRCARLDVSVDSRWKACSLACSPFEERLSHPTYEVSGIAKWDAAPVMKKVSEVPVPAIKASVFS